jgi:hypothetical protein
MAETGAHPPAANPDPPRLGIFRMLGDKFDALRAPSPVKALEETLFTPGPQVPPGGEPSPQRGRAGSRATVVEVEPAASVQVDAHEKDDVIRLLKQCIAAAQAEEDLLRKRIAQLEKDAAFWKAESYSGIQGSMSAIATSPQYVEMKERLNKERARTVELEKELESRKEAQQNSVAAAVVQASLEEANVALARARQELEKERQERATEQKGAAARDQEWKARVAAMQTREAQLLEQVAAAKQETEASAAHANRFARELAATSQAGEKLKADARAAKEEAEAAKTLLAARQKPRMDDSEFQCLQRDREMLSDQLYEAQRRIKALEQGPAPSAPRRGGGGKAPVAQRREEVVEVQALIVPEPTEADLLLQSRFKLPESERQTAVHGCSLGATHGFLYLSAEHLCFGGSSVNSFFDQARDVVLKMGDVVSLDKTGKTHLKVHTRDGAMHEFASLRHRKLLAVQISNATARLGAPRVEILREGHPDANTGIGSAIDDDDFVLVPEK